MIFRKLNYHDKWSYNTSKTLSLFLKKKTFYIISNLKNKGESSPPKPSIETHP